MRVPPWVVCVVPGVFLSSRVNGACPVTTDLIMRVDVRTTPTTTTQQQRQQQQQQQQQQPQYIYIMYHYYAHQYLKYVVVCCSSHENDLLVAEQRSSAVVTITINNLFMCEISIFLKLESKKPKTGSL